MDKETTIITVIREVLAQTDGIEEVTSKIGKTYPTLMREINPYDKNAKLGIETLFDIMKVTRDIRPLEYIANELGFRVVPKEQTSE